MKFPILISYLIYFAINTYSQTTGYQSPIIKGANAKISYIKKEHVRLNIPDSLSQYLAGLLMSNNITYQKNIDEALFAWTTKYNSLKNLIKLANPAIQNLASKELSKGNFTEVEKIIKQPTDHISYNGLIKLFPNSYQTNGNQSPIIIGDYANVTYTVTQIIEYNLPEGVTLGLLSELKSRENSLKRQGIYIKYLEHSIDDKSELVEKWVTKYKELAEMLKYNPDTIARKAYGLYIVGDLKGALEILELASGSELSMAKNRILKAKILLLQLGYDSTDIELKKIKNYYMAAIPFLSDYKNLMDFARFMVDYGMDYSNAIPALNLALPLATNLSEQIEVRNYLALIFVGTNKDKAIEYLESSLNLLNKNEPLIDSILIDQKAKIEFNLATTYMSGLRDSSVIRKSILILNNAIKNQKRLSSCLKNNYKIALFRQIRGGYYYQINDTLNSIKDHFFSMSFFESNYEKNPSYVFLLSSSYRLVGEYYGNRGNVSIALKYFEKARFTLQPKLNVNTSNYLGPLMQIYSDILRTYEPIGQLDSINSNLTKMEEIIRPFTVVNNGQFAFYQPFIYTDLGKHNLTVGNYKTAKEYLTKAFQYFDSNYSLVQIDKSKFSTCIISLNNCYISLNEIDKAITNNHLLKAKLTKLYATNPTVFNEFIPQIYALIAEDYSAMQNNNDSDLFYSLKAMELAHDLAMDYPILYNNLYFDITLKTCNIFLKKGKWQTADSIVLKYINSWNDSYKISTFSKNNLACSIAENIGKLANLFQMNMLVRTNSKKTIKQLYKIADKYYTIAENQFMSFQNKNQMDLFRFGSFLTARATYENSLISLNLIKDTNKYTKNKCNYAKRALDILNTIPPSINSNQILLQLKALTTNCNL